jgi:tetratricopeptide (TPR) repeat protein
LVARRPWRSAGVVALLGLIALGPAVVAWWLYAGSHRDAALREAEHYHYVAARPHVEKWLEAEPDNPEALLLAARVARRLRAFDVAAEYLTKYKGLRGEDDDLLLERILLRAEHGEMDAVGEFCRTLVEKGHPATPRILEALTAGYLYAYRLAEAEYCLRQWLDRQPDNTAALFFMGNLYEFRQAPQEAVVAYRRAVELDAGYDEARQRLAGCLVDLSQPEEALPQLGYLHRRHPEDVQVSLDLARCLDLRGEQERAEETLDELLARSPRFAPALVERAKLAMRSASPAALARAEEWLRQAVASSPSDYQAVYQFGLCLRLRKKGAEAKALQPVLKRIEADNKRLQQIATGEMSLNPHRAALHYEVGMIAFRAGAIESAVNWLKSALREDPAYAPAHKALYYYYARIGEQGRAMRHLEQAQAAGPEAAAAEPAKAAPGP